MSETKNIKFDFGNSNKVEELNKAKATETPIEAPELIDNTSEAKENKHETKAEETSRAIVTYLGRGVWEDAKGESWRHNDSKSYTINEYHSREDLNFMVKYGEMKLSLV